MGPKTKIKIERLKRVVTYPIQRAAIKFTTDFRLVIMEAGRHLSDNGSPKVEK